MNIKEAISKINLPAKASLFYLMASVVGKGVGVLTTPFFTRLINESEYGILTLYMTLLGGASVICSAINSGSAIYRGFKKFESKSSDFTKSALATSCGFSLLICLLLFTFSSFFGLKRWLFLPLTLQILCDTIIGVSMSKAKYSYKYFEVSLTSILSSALPAVLSVILLYFLPGGYVIRIFSLLFFSLIIASWQMVKIGFSGGRIDKNATKYLFFASLPLLPHSITVAVSAQADKLFITRIMGESALARYSVVHALGIALQFAVGAIGSALGPWLIRRLDAKEYAKVSQVVSTLFSLFSALSLVICGLAPEVMSLLAPEKYSIALPALVPIALSTPIFLLSYVITVCLVHKSRGKMTAGMSFIGLLLCILLDFILIPKFGYFGAGVSLFISQLGSVIFGIFALTKCNLSETVAPLRTSMIFIFSLAIGFSFLILYGARAWRFLLMIFPILLGLSALPESLRLIKEKGFPNVKGAET